MNINVNGRGYKYYLPSEFTVYDDKDYKVTIEFPSYRLDINNSYGSEKNRIEYCKILEKLYSLKPEDNYDYLNLK